MYTRGNIDTFTIRGVPKGRWDVATPSLIVSLLCFTEFDDFLGLSLRTSFFDPRKLPSKSQPFSICILKSASKLQFRFTETFLDLFKIDLKKSQKK